MFSSNFTTHNASIVKTSLLLGATWLGKMMSMVSKSPRSDLWRDLFTSCQVNCQAHPNLCSQAGVNSYPTARLYKNPGQNIVEYQGNRQLDDLKGFLQAQGVTE
mmetsp:Transcript_20732/g.49270  ORF Transcript_20732/g.49270 Transcript_20732/m.49270 type:complete len:104 (+) Transcript_20732:160-471(+)